MPLHIFISFIWNIWSKIVKIYTSMLGFGDSREDEGNEQQVEEEIKQVTQRQTAQKHEDTVDFGFGDNFRRALERVSETIYSLYISPWYNAPEEMKDQLLYRELSNAIQNTYFKAQKKAHHIEGYEIIIIAANILTDHLKSFRKKRRIYREMMRKEEIDIIRHHTKAMLCCFLPDSLTESKHVLVFLNEIIQISLSSLFLEPSISTWADPSFINEQIITSLGLEVNGTDGHSIETHENLDRATSDTLECQQLQYSSQKGTKKSKFKIVKGYFKRLFKKSPRSFGNDTCGMYKSWNTAEDPRTSEKGFVSIDGPLPIENSDDVCSKWKEEKWIARVSVMKDGMYRICVLQSDMQTEAWNVKRSFEDFIQVHSILSQKHPCEVPTSPISKDYWKSNKQLVADFVDKLVKLIKECNDKEAAFFLSPFKYTEDEAELFHAIFIDKVATEEELQDSSLDMTLTENSDDDSSETDGCDFKMLKLRKRKKDKKLAAMDNDEKKEDSESNSEVMLEYIKEASKSTGPVNWQSRPGQQDNAVGLLNYNRVKQVTADNVEAETRKGLRKELFKCLCLLADEILGGGYHIFTFLNSCGAFKTHEETVCQCVTWLFAEEQMVVYLDKLSDMMMNSEDVPQLQTQPADIHQKQALERIKETLMSFTSDRWLYKFLLNHSEKYMEMSLNALQDPVANKYALFRLLKEFTEYITGEPQEPACEQQTNS